VSSIEAAHIQQRVYLARDAQSDRERIAQIYHEDEPDGVVFGQATHQRRGVADCGQHSEAAGWVRHKIKRGPPNLDGLVLSGEPIRRKPVTNYPACI